MNTDQPSSAPSSVIEWFYRWERESPDRAFLKQPFGQHWKTISYSQAGDQARRITRYLQDQGLKPGDHVGLLSKNCYHWIMADLAIMMGGFVSVPYYASLPKAQLTEVIKLSDIKALFVGKLDQWGDKAEAVPSQIKVIRFPQYEDNAKVTQGACWDQLIQNHQPIEHSFAPDLNDLWTIKFTSGTTGTPKGVMHAHRTPGTMMLSEQQTNWIGLSKLDKLNYLSYLPLNHVAERLGIEVPAIYFGGTISFAESIETFADNIQQVQPSVFIGVPRIWTKFYLGVIDQISPAKLKILLKIPLVSNLLKQRIRRGLGLGNVQIAATGAAITPAFIKEFFEEIGIHLIEAYGMTETCGSITNGPDIKTPADSVGKVIPGGQVAIDPDSGEILLKSPYMMTGYYNCPELTKEVLVDDWMHSGDRGEIDPDGNLRVVGRVSDAFKTAKGSFVTPNPIEEEMGKNENIENICVVGLGLTQPIALINLTDSATKRSKQQIKASIDQTLAKTNASRSKYERLASIVIVSENWSESNRLLTPTLKVKRSEIDARYKNNYQTWLQQSDNVIWFDEE